MSLVELKVPDIGDFTDVDVIEVNIKAGDVIEKEQGVITLETDKATMEVPSDVAGTIKEVKVKAGDKVSQGSVVAMVETAEAGAAAAAPKADAPKEAPAANANAGAKPAAGGGTQEVKVPDIGDFSDIPVIEVHVKPGDTVEKEQSLVTLESDKATMDVPSPAAGTVKELKVKVGDNVSEGVVILTLEGAGGGAAAAEAKPQQAAPQAAAPGRGCARAQSGQLLGRRGHRMRHGRDRRGPRRLFRRVPLRRPRHEDGARRTVCDARRRVPERRLYSVEGAVAHGARARRSQGARTSRHHVRRPVRSISTNCAASRKASSRS